MDNATKEPSQQQLRKLLVDLRLRRGLSQASLAARLGKPQSFVSKYETGERRLDAIEFATICRALEEDPIAVFRALIGDEQTTVLDQWDIDAVGLTSLLNANPSLRGMLLGYVAERKLQTMIADIPGVSFIAKPDDHNRLRKGDLQITYRGKEFRIESKIAANQHDFLQRRGRHLAREGAGGRQRPQDGSFGKRRTTANDVAEERRI